MTTNLCFLAEYSFGLEDVAAGWRSMSSSALGSIALVVAIGLVTLLALVWAAFFRKRGRRRRSRQHSHRRSQASPELAEAPAEEPAPAPLEQPRKQRRSRRRRRNPTLAETGGLPPVRSESPPEPQT